MSEQNTNIGVQPLYAARVEHLVHAPFVGAKCDNCGHHADVAVAAVRRMLPDWFRVPEIYRAMRCTRCETKGKVTMDFRRALGHDKLDERMEAHRRARADRRG